MPRHSPLASYRGLPQEYAVPITAYILTVAGAYLLGSLPTGYLVAKAKGVDIRTVGSGNIGATNVFRYLGTTAGVFVLLVDALKGFAAVQAALQLWPRLGPELARGHLEWLALTAGFCAVLGHNYTCWLGFKGGKGIATSAGVLVALVPWAFLIVFGLWAVVLGVTRYMSLASITAAIALPFATWFTTLNRTLLGVTALLATLAVYKHKANIQRLLKGTENRLGARKAPPEGGAK